MTNQGALERWVYDDDELGLIEVVAGSYDDLRRLDPGWPADKKEWKRGKAESTDVLSAQAETDAAETDADSDPESAKSGAGAAFDWNRQPGDMLAQGVARSVAKRPGLASRLEAFIENGDKGMLVTVGGRTVARVRTVTSHRAALRGKVKDGTFSDFGSSAPDRLQIKANGLTHQITEIYLHRKSGSDTSLVALAPPPGSAGERRAAAMEASPWKRVAYPLAGGFGKAGGAVAAIVLIPLIGRLVGWLWGLVEPHVPEFEIPWPDWQLPSIPWPDWDLPSIPWPDIDLPDVTLPGWVEVVLDYQKIWLPILLGLVVGVIAYRRQKKARRAPHPDAEGWADGGTDAETPPERSAEK